MAKKNFEQISVYYMNKASLMWTISVGLLGLTYAFIAYEGKHTLVNATLIPLAGIIFMVAGATNFLKWVAYEKKYLISRGIKTPNLLVRFTYAMKVFFGGERDI